MDGARGVQDYLDELDLGDRVETEPAAPAPRLAVLGPEIAKNCLVGEGHCEVG